MEEEVSKPKKSRTVRGKKDRKLLHVAQEHSEGSGEKIYTGAVSSLFESIKTGSLRMTRDLEDEGKSI